MRKRRARAVLGVLILALLIPIFYLASPSFTAGPQPREHQYSTSPESDIDANAVLSTVAQSMNAAQLGELRDKLSALVRLPGVVHLPVSTDDPLLEYLQTVQDFSNLMAQIAEKLDNARHALAAGRGSLALADLQQLKDLRSETRPLLRAMDRLLDRVADEYEIDVSDQRQKLDELNALFQEYSQQIDQLSSRVGPLQGLVPTTLTLNATRSQIYVTENFFVYGHLSTENGTVLVGRNITISTGPNQTVMRATDLAGRFNVSLSYPVGLEAGFANIRASFLPEGPDALTFEPALASIQILLEYYPSVMTAEIAPRSARPTEHVEVRGILTGANGVPLSARSVTITLDAIVLGTSITASSGNFSFVLTVPPTVANGTHSLDVRFDPANDAFAASNVTLPFIVNLIGSQVQISLDRTSILSGMSLGVGGTVAYDNGTLSNRGIVRIYVDDQEYGMQGLNGSFRFVITPFIGLSFGRHSIRAVYTPLDPWVQGSSEVSEVYVINTPILAAVVVAVPTLSGLGVYWARRRRLRALAPALPAQPLPVEKPLLKEEFTPKSLISAVNAELDHAGRIGRSFRLARALINRKLGEPSRESETHWEYYDRISTRIPQIRNTLKRLIELFELAEYGPEPAEAAQSRQATEILLELREEIEAVE